MSRQSDVREGERLYLVQYLTLRCAHVVSVSHDEIKVAAVIGYDELCLAPSELVALSAARHMTRTAEDALDDYVELCRDHVEQAVGELKQARDLRTRLLAPRKDK